MTLGDPMDCSMPGFPLLHYLMKFAQTHMHWIDDAIQPSHPLLPLFLLPSVIPSIRVFSNESALHIRWPKYWSFSFSISPFNDYSGLIFFRMDCFDLLAIQGTFKSLLHNHNLKASVHQCLAFFMVQLPHPYMTTGKTTALTIQFFVSKVMPLLFSTLFRFVITFLPRSKRLLISWLQSSSTVFLESKKIVCHCFHLFPHLFAMKWWDCMPWSSFFFKFYFIFKLYIIVLVLPNIKMNPPKVYLCSPSWTLLPPPSPYHPSGSSQCTSPKHPVSCIKPDLHFLNVVLSHLFTLLFCFHQEAL